MCTVEAERVAASGPPAGPHVGEELAKEGRDGGLQVPLRIFKPNLDGTRHVPQDAVLPRHLVQLCSAAEGRGRGWSWGHGGKGACLSVLQACVQHRVGG